MNLPPKHHEMKCWPQYLLAVLTGRKKFEIRFNDRDFQVGDTIRLNGYDPNTGDYTGQSAQFVITYITAFEQKPGFVVMGIEQ